jgi:TetR/AcrR family transcriptional regulator
MELKILLAKPLGVYLFIWLNQMIKNTKRRSPTQPSKAPKESPKTSPKGAKSGQKAVESRILKAARSEFIALGLGGARMRAIALKAKVNPALLHYYFRDKTSLYQAALLDTMQSVWGQLEIPMVAFDTGTNLQVVLKDMVRRYLTFVLGHSEFPRFILREIIDGGKHFALVIKEVQVRFGGMLAALAGALNREAEAGRMRPIQPLNALLNIAGMAISSVIYALVAESLAGSASPLLTLTPEYAERRVDEIVVTFFDGMRTLS